MKIFDPGIYHLKGDAPASKDRKKEEPAGPSFSEILENASASKAAAGRSAAVSTFDALGQMETLNPAQKDALAKGEEILGLLSHLGKLLESSEASDSAARSAAEAISGRIDELRVLREGLDASDPLRDTLNEIGTLSIVEHVKIVRGDYG